MMLPCRRCGSDLPLDAFTSAPRNTGRHGRHSWCTSCIGAANKVRRQADPERTRALGRKHARRKRLRSYGLDEASFDALLEAQGGACAICRRPESVRANLAVDHDHETGAVRGLLCFGCNTGLGRFGDDVEMLRAAVAYLEQAA